jgi:ABC-type nickel/cobalt efflux system permease component RcnA
MASVQAAFLTNGGSGMPDVAHGPWWVVAAAAAPSVASAIWVLWRWWIERGDKLHETVTSREQTLLRDLEAQRVALSREQAELFERLRTEVERIRLRLVEVEQDRDHGWDLARWWNQRAHEMRHAAVNAQTMVMGFCSREGVDPPAWPEMELPGLEEPK